MSTSTSQLIETIKSRQEIYDVLARYCRSMDRRDNPLGYGVFHEDAIVDFGDIFRGSGREYIDFVFGYHQTLESHHHEIGNTLIEVSGDQAAAETYVTVTVVWKSDTGFILRTAVGRYLDLFARRDRRWAISHRRYERSFRWDQKLDTVVIGAGHGPDDLSYELLSK